MIFVCFYARILWFFLLKIQEFCDKIYSGDTKDSLIPVEVKANDNPTVSLNNLIDGKKYKDIKYGIKLCNKNIGFNGKFYTFPYFLTFLLKRYLKKH